MVRMMVVIMMTRFHQKRPGTRACGLPLPQPRPASRRRLVIAPPPPPTVPPQPPPTVVGATGTRYRARVLPVPLVGLLTALLTVQLLALT